MLVKEVTFKIADTEPLKLREKVKKLELISRLNDDDLDRLYQIAKEPKALTKLKSNWTILKTML